MAETFSNLNVLDYEDPGGVNIGRDH